MVVDQETLEFQRVATMSTSSSCYQGLHGLSKYSKPIVSVVGYMNDRHIYWLGLLVFLRTDFHLHELRLCFYLLMDVKISYSLTGGHICPTLPEMQWNR